MIGVSSEHLIDRCIEGITYRLVSVDGVKSDLFALAVDVLHGNAVHSKRAVLVLRHLKMRWRAVDDLGGSHIVEGALAVLVHYGVGIYNVGTGGIEHRLVGELYLLLRRYGYLRRLVV